VSVDHYENFPVASVLCPPAIRPAVVAIYRFARTADDIADEGDASPEARREALWAMRADLASLYRSAPHSARWQAVFAALDAARVRHDLPEQLLADLLDAFIQDTHAPRPSTRSDLLDYCRRSANPVGRLLLHLYGIGDPKALAQSDAICSALQLINFWQDCSRDLPQGRVYLPAEDARCHGVALDPHLPTADTPATRALIADLCDWAESLMLQGAPLPLRVPGRAGWELRLVVQGGLRVLEKIRQMRYGTITQRPRLGALDWPLLAWRAMRMRQALSAVPA
jgi:squalene synthase HpnC